MPLKRLGLADKWDVIGGDDEIATPDVAHKIKRSRDGLTLWYVTGTPDGGPSDVGVLRKSTDFGETWSDPALPTACDGCLDVVQDLHDVYWGLFYNSSIPGGGDGYTAIVAHSTNLSSWTIAYTATAGWQAFNIAVAPSGHKIAFTMRNAQGSPGLDGSRYRVVISSDSGATWISRTVMNLESSAETQVPLISFHLDGKLILMAQGTERPNTDVPFIYSLAISQDEQEIYILTISEDLSDQLVWVIDVDGNFIRSFTIGPNDSGFVGIAVDNDDVVWYYNTSGFTPTTYSRFSNTGTPLGSFDDTDFVANGIRADRFAGGVLVLGQVPPTAPAVCVRRYAAGGFVDEYGRGVLGELVGVQGQSAGIAVAPSNGAFYVGNWNEDDGYLVIPFTTGGVAGAGFSVSGVAGIRAPLFATTKLFVSLGAFDAPSNKLKELSLVGAEEAEAELGDSQEAYAGVATADTVFIATQFPLNKYRAFDYSLNELWSVDQDV